MKKLISLLAAMVLTIPMWAINYTYSTSVASGSGTAYICTGSSFSGTKTSVSQTAGSSYKLTMKATPAANNTFLGWATSSSATSYISTDATYTVSAPYGATTYYAFFAAAAPTSQTANYKIGSTNYTMNAYNMGTGDNILWGDRAVGASGTGVVGLYYQYGNVTACTGSASSSYSYSGVYTTTNALPADCDPATAALGEGWRTPTSAEYTTLMSTATVSRTSSSVQSITAVANSKTIYFYMGGYKYTTSVSYASSSGNAYYWTSTKYSSSEAYRLNLSHTTSSSSGYVSGKSASGSNHTTFYYAQQIKPVYDVANYTLTVKADGTTSTNYSGKWGATQSVTASKTGKVFKRWNDGNTSNPRTFKICNITYTAEFEDPKVTATFNNWDGTELYKNTNVTSGTTPTYGGSTPTKPSTEEYDYTFNDWSPALGNITSNTTYTATFTAVPKVVNVTATFNDYNGTQLYQNTSVQSGTTPTYGGSSVPDYTADGYTYRFNGTWSPALGTITADQTYTAQYDKYVTATFQNEAGVTVGSVLVKEGTAPSDADGISGISGPAKTGTTDGYTYTFDTWKTSADVLYTVAITDHTTYLPAYTRVARELTLLDKGSDDYYQGIAAEYYDEDTPVYLRKITYNRSFPALKWSTFSLPFNWTIDEDSPLDGIVYSFDGATGDYTSLNVSFSAGVTEIEAGVPYLLYPTEKLDALVFDLDNTESNTQLYLTDAIINDGDDAVSVTVGTGQVTFSATNRGYTLYGQTKNDAVNETWKDYLFLSNNRLYYPNRNGNTLYAFRAFFHVNSGAGVAPRMRITANGQTIEIDEADANTTDEQSAARVRKTIENGVLIIERNGNRYNAQGAMIQ